MWTSLNQVGSRRGVVRNYCRRTTVMYFLSHFAGIVFRVFSYSRHWPFVSSKKVQESTPFAEAQLTGAATVNLTPLSTSVLFPSTTQFKRPMSSRVLFATVNDDVNAP